MCHEEAIFPFPKRTLFFITKHPVPCSSKKTFEKLLSSKYCQILTQVNRIKDIKGIYAVMYYVFINSLILSSQWTLLIPTWSGFVTCLFGVIPPVLDLLYGHYPLHFKLQLYFCQLPLFYHTISLVIKYRPILTAVYRFWAFQNLDTQNKVS